MWPLSWRHDRHRVLTEPFRRGTERVRTDEHAGAGPGLAIAHGVVRAHGGSLDLVPRPGGGPLVTVPLPGAGQAPDRQRKSMS